MKPVKAEIISKILTRLSASMGDPFGRDSKLLLVQMAHEFAHTLAGFEPPVIDTAVTEWIRKNPRWPKPCELRELCVTIAKELAPPPVMLPAPAVREPERVFEREGRTQAEEIAHRAAQILRWKAQAMTGAQTPASSEQSGRDVPQHHDASTQ